MSSQRHFRTAKELAPYRQTCVSHPAIILCIQSFIFLFSVTNPSMAASVGWAATYGGVNYDIGRSIQQTSDGGYIVTGETDSFGAGEDDIWVLKLRLDGAVEWQKTYGGKHFDSAEAIQQTGDGGYIMAGETNSFGAGRRDLWVLKLEPGGAVEWQKTYGESGYDPPQSIQQTTDGGYIVAGETDSFGAGEEDFLVLKLRPDGTVEWQKTYGGGNFDKATSIQQTGDGGYIVAGMTESFAVGGGYIPDTLFLRLGPEGTIEWQKVYGDIDFDMTYSVRQTSDGGYIVAGSTGYVWGSRVDTIATIGSHAWVLKLRSDGTADWQKTYAKGNFDRATSIQLAGDGGYIVAGETNSFGTRHADFWVLKLRPDGTINPSCNFIRATYTPLKDSYVTVMYSSAVVRDSNAKTQDSSAMAQDTNVSENVLCASTAAE